MNKCDYIGLVSGTTWKCRMINDAIFETWTPTIWNKKTARKELLKEAVYYESKDIVSIWETK